jgi:hypothetical protein
MAMWMTSSRQDGTALQESVDYTYTSFTVRREKIGEFCSVNCNIMFHQVRKAVGGARYH